MTTRWLSDPQTAPLIRDAGQAYVVVETNRGPHVTPQRVTESGGRLWFSTSRRSRKVAALRRRPRAGVLVRSGLRTAVLGGSFAVIDPVDPLSWLSCSGDVIRSGRAFMRLVRRHAADVVGYGLSATQVPFDWLPASRVLLAFRADRALVVDDGGAVVQRRGPWTRPRPVTLCGDGADRTDDLPCDVLREFGDEPSGAMAWQGPDGPVAAWARWQPDRRVLQIPTALAEIADDSQPPAAFCVSRSGGIRPTGKSGALLRGRARLVEHDGAWVDVGLEVETVTWWSGFESSTRSVEEVGVADDQVR